MIKTNLFDINQEDSEQNTILDYVFKNAKDCKLIEFVLSLPNLKRKKHKRLDGTRFDRMPKSNKNYEKLKKLFENN